MKIINKTGFTLNYVVTSSGTTLADAEKSNQIAASGTVNKNSTSDVSLGAQYINPAVYVGRQVTSGDSTVSVSIDEQ